MSRIGLFEVSHHSHILYYLSRMSGPDANQVTIFTTESIYDRIAGNYDEDELESYDWHLQRESNSLDRFFDEVEERCSREMDFLSVNTPHASGRVTSNFVDFDPDCPTLGWIYDVRRWCHNHPAILYRMAEAVHRPIRTSFPGDGGDVALEHLKPLLPPSILENFDAVNVEYPPLKRYLEREEGWTRSIHTLAPTLYEPYEADPSDGKFRVVVPGSLSTDIRDYDTVLDAFEWLFEAGGGDLSLELLGRPVGEGSRIVRRCEEFQAAGYDVSFYREWVGHEEFTEAIRRSDLILSPVRVNRPMRHPLKPDKIMGTTQGTGVIFDAIRHAKPIILPGSFNVDEIIEDITLTYDSPEHLLNLLEGLVHDETRLEDLLEAARRNSMGFSLGRQQERFQHVLDQMVR